MKNQKSIDIYLAYSGLIPFLFFTICLLFNYKYTLIFGNTIQALSTYGLIIASFLAGTHWGKQINIEPSITKSFLQISSNINVIAIWFAYLNLNSKYFILLLIIEFLVLLKIDHYIYILKIISSRYFLYIRLPITVAVVILLLISWSLI
ncbi:DUF3429 domain-containing protein [Francisella hispaniensis]|uniref:DUF3429 domain-containing protein n=1 Tax=Francisella hispaniensis FSC454 TaxID=1088883 RepID=A0AAC9NNS4_9GAMM|nr:DUF3429 domain-containing protein [Francisella hispaniensis]APD51085.1 DUF3429 domain-containing protein [Francisella hispaniensis FSC454]KYW86749.1 hypothetical protein AUF42_00710 [Francisella hispaniensis FSC454]